MNINVQSSFCFLNSVTKFKIELSILFRIVFKSQIPLIILKIIIKSAEAAHRGGVRLNDAAADGATVVERLTIFEENAINAIVGAVAVVGGMDLTFDIFGVGAV